MTTTDSHQIDESVEPTGPANWAEAAMETISGDLAADERCEDVTIGWSTHSLEASEGPTDTLFVLTGSRIGFGRTVHSELPRWIDFGDITNVDAIEGLRYPGIVLELAAVGHDAFYVGVESAFVDSFVAALQRSAQPSTDVEESPVEAPDATPEVARGAVVTPHDPVPAADEETVTTATPDYSTSDYGTSPWDAPVSDPTDLDGPVPPASEPAPPTTVLIGLPQVDPEPMVDPEPLVSDEPVADMFAPLEIDDAPVESEIPPIADAQPVESEIAPTADVSPVESEIAPTAGVETSPAPVADDADPFDPPGADALGSMESSLPNFDDTPDDDLPDALRIESFDHDSLLAVGDTPPWLDPEMRWPRPLRGVQYLGGHPNHPRKRKNGIFGISPNGIDAEGAGFGDWSMNVQWAFINDIMVVGPDEATFNLGIRIGPKNSVISVEMADGTMLNFEVRGKGPSTVRADLGPALGMAGAARQYRAAHGDVDPPVTDDDDE